MITGEAPLEPAAWVGLASIAVSRGDWLGAKQRWADCIRDFPDHVQLWWRSNLAQAHLQLLELDEAQQLYEQLAADHSENPAGAVGLAILDNRRENWRLAHVRWQACFERFPAMAAPWWYSAHAQALV